MAKVQFTYALKRFFPGLENVETDAKDVRTLLDKLNNRYPGLKGYILEDHGALRQHVNIFIDNQLISDRENLSDAIGNDAEVFIMQALSGG